MAPSTNPYAVGAGSGSALVPLSVEQRQFRRLLTMDPQALLDVIAPSTGLPLTVASVRASLREGDGQPLTLDQQGEISAHLARVQALVGSPEMRAGLATILSTPQLLGPVLEVMDRGPELMAVGRREGEAHRLLTPLLAGIYASPPAAAVFDAAMDAAVLHQTERVRRALAAGLEIEDLDPGAGWHGSVQAGEARALRPQGYSIAIDANSWIGGHFRYGGFFEVNSRVRLTRDDLPNLPRTFGNLNPMGPHAVLLQEDVEGDAYGLGTRLGGVIGANMYLSAGGLLVKTELVFVRPLPGGRYESTLRYVDTGEYVTVSHSGMGAALGFTKPASGFEQSSAATQRLVADEQRRPLHERQFLLFPDVGARVGELPFPLQGVRNACVIGAKDGGRVAVLRLLGYDGGQRSAANLDWVRTLTWYAQPSSTKEEAAAKERPLYAKVVLGLPRDDGGAFQTTPIADRAAELCYVHAPDGTRRIAVTSFDAAGRARTEAFDLVVSAAGYVDMRGTVFGPLQATRISDLPKISAAVRVGLPVGSRLQIGSSVYDVVASKSAIDRQGPTVTLRLRESAGPDPFGAALVSGALVELGPNAVTSQIIVAAVRAGLTAASTSPPVTLELPAKQLATEFVYASGDITAGPTILTDRAEILTRIETLIRTPGVVFDRGDGSTFRIVRFDSRKQEATILLTVPGERLEPGGVAGPPRTLKQRVPLTPGPGRAALDREVFLATAASVPAVGGNLTAEPPVALRIAGTKVTIIGPDARLPLLDIEIQRTPVYRRIPANTAAAFRYVRLTVSATGDRVANSPSTFLDVWPQFDGGSPTVASTRVVGIREPGVRPSSPSSRPGPDISVPLPAADLPLRRLTPENALRLAVSLWNGRTSLDPRFKDMSITVRIAQGGADTATLVASVISRRLRRDPDVQAAVADLLADPLAQAALQRLSRGTLGDRTGGTTAATRSQTMVISLPVRFDGRVSPGDVHASPVAVQVGA